MIKGDRPYDHEAIQRAVAACRDAANTMDLFVSDLLNPENTGFSYPGGPGSLTLDMVDEQPPMVTIACRTWIRLEQQAPRGAIERGEAFDRIYNTLPCDELRAAATSQ